MVSEKAVLGPLPDFRQPNAAMSCMKDKRAWGLSVCEGASRV